MTTIRTLEADGTLCEHNDTPESAPAGCRAWFAYPDRAQRGATIVFGHWAALGLRLGADWLALDSGCAWGGPLTAVRVEDRRVFQTRAHRLIALERATPCCDSDKFEGTAARRRNKSV